MQADKVSDHPSATRPCHLAKKTQRIRIGTTKKYRNGAHPARSSGTLRVFMSSFTLLLILGRLQGANLRTKTDSI